MRWILGIILNALILMGIAYFFDGFMIEGFWAAIIASVILQLVNAIVKPILVVLTLPITIVTLGLFLLVINALTLMLTAALMGDMFVIDGFLIALITSIILSILQTFIVRPVKS